MVASRDCVRVGLGSLSARTYWIADSASGDSSAVSTRVTSVGRWIRMPALRQSAQ